jgi:hypothetical protein
MKWKRRRFFKCAAVALAIQWVPPSLVWAGFDDCDEDPDCWDDDPGPIDSGPQQGGESDQPEPDNDIGGQEDVPAAGSGADPVDAATGSRMGDGSAFDLATGGLSSGSSGAFADWLAEGWGQNSCLIDSQDGIAATAQLATDGSMQGQDSTSDGVRFTGDFSFGLEREAPGVGALLQTDVHMETVPTTVYLPVAEAGGVYYSYDLSRTGESTGGAGIYLGLPNELTAFAGTDFDKPEPNLQVGVLAGPAELSGNFDFSGPYNSFIATGAQMMESLERGLYEYTQTMTYGF